MASVEGQSQKTLLIVEDDADIREVLLAAFEKQDWIVYGAENGMEALEILGKFPVDAVMSDIKMPVMDGLQLLMAVRERGMDTPFLFLTANGDKQSAILALRLGAMDFIEKPFQIEALRKQVEKAVELGYALRILDEESASQTGQDGASAHSSEEQLRKAKKALLIARKQRAA